ncbi:FAD/NAD(P)-binding domain-containing protein [Trametopsis cervina]|nr:FAD/NAD(P)-binding domain-containing protein [Trametopsis cervina]
MYDSLTTNLPHPIMAFSSFPFPPSTDLYPPASTVLDYLGSYASHFNVDQHVRLNAKVESLEWDSAISRWRVQTKTKAKELGHEDVVEVSEFDLVIVANGHYTVPYYPPIPGLAAWRNSGKVMHSAWYRHAEYKGETVLIVGRGPSGIDVADEMQAVSRTVIQSASGAAPSDSEDGSFKLRGRIAEFLDVSTGLVRFADGTTESGIDFCILATGYEHSQPYLPSSLLRLSLPPPVPPIPEDLYNSGFHIFPLAKHIFPLSTSIPSSSLAFVALPYRIVPFPLAELQMRAIVKVLADPSSLDSSREAVEIISRYEELRAQVGDNEQLIARLWHKLDEQAQFDYRDGLLDFVRNPGEPEEKVPQWLRDMYPIKMTIRAEWKDLVRRGEAEAWIKGVGEVGGEAGQAEWVALMWKLVERAKNRHSQSSGPPASLL